MNISNSSKSCLPRVWPTLGLLLFAVTVVSRWLLAPALALPYAISAGVALSGVFATVWLIMEGLIVFFTGRCTLGELLPSRWRARLEDARKTETTTTEV